MLRLYFRLKLGLINFLVERKRREFTENSNARIGGTNFVKIPIAVIPLFISIEI
jgi:hypothetical protein